MSKQLDGGFESRIALADDFVEFCGAHPSLLQLLEGTSGLDSLVLSRVANKEHAIIWCKASEKLAHLASARQARLIDKVEPPGFCGYLAWTGARKKGLQSYRFDPRLTELFCGAGSGREALDLVALTFGCGSQNRQRRRFTRSGESLNALNFVCRTQHFFNDAFLSPIQVRMILSNLIRFGPVCHRAVPDVGLPGPDE